jgi:hypothetical protein
MKKIQIYFMKMTASTYRPIKISDLKQPVYYHEVSVVDDYYDILISGLKSNVGSAKFEEGFIRIVIMFQKDVFYVDSKGCITYKNKSYFPNPIEFLSFYSFLVKNNIATFDV